MGWISNAIGNWGLSVQEKEIREFVSSISSMDGAELGLLVALATDRRHILEAANGWLFLEPAVAKRRDISLPMTINSVIQMLQKDGHQLMASGLMVWLHTLRSCDEPKLRPYGRAMWGHLERGFRHVESARDHFAMAGGNILIVDGYDQFPEGLTPQPKE